MAQSRPATWKRFIIPSFSVSGPPFIDGCALSGLHSQPLMPDFCGTPPCLTLRPIGLALRPAAFLLPAGPPTPLTLLITPLANELCISSTDKIFFRIPQFFSELRNLLI